MSLPGSEATVRGYSAARLIVVDEAARCPDDLLAAVRPTLATSAGGRLVALSTPAGKKGWFYQTWTFGGPEWRRFRVTAEECQRISRAFLAAEERELGPLLYASEYRCEFTDDNTAVFMSAIIEAALSDGVAPLFAV